MLVIVNKEELAEPKYTKKTKMCLKLFKKFGGCVLRPPRGWMRPRRYRRRTGAAKTELGTSSSSGKLLFILEF